MITLKLKHDLVSSEKDWMLSDILVYSTTSKNTERRCFSILLKTLWKEFMLFQSFLFQCACKYVCTCVRVQCVFMHVEIRVSDSMVSELQGPPVPYSTMLRLQPCATLSGLRMWLLRTKLSFWSCILLITRFPQPQIIFSETSKFWLLKRIKSQNEPSFFINLKNYE